MLFGFACAGEIGLLPSLEEIGSQPSLAEIGSQPSLGQGSDARPSPQKGHLSQRRLGPNFSKRADSAHSRTLIAAILALLLTACGSSPKKPSSVPTTTATSSGTNTKPGGYYQNDGPGPAGSTPNNLDAIPDAVPRTEKYHSGANKPYTVFGRTYVPVVTNEPFRQTGMASWYGRKYHGNTTSIGEVYDMYAMTAAHPTLPLPSYVRVTNPANQKTVVVRVNDRGPFLAERIIDLSYVAAHRLGLVQKGSGLVTVERVFAGTGAGAGTASTPPPRPPTTAATPNVTPTAIEISPITTEDKALFLQLGAFSGEDNANIFRDRMTRELDWNREPLLVHFRDGLWRVRMGPYTSRAEAEAILARVRTSHDFSPVISTNK